MLKQIVSTLCFIFYLSTSAFAGASDLFVVTSNGTGNSISITLCLNINGNKPISCQNYTVPAGILTIKTTIPNRTYQYVGIRVNTQGYGYSSPSSANGYSFVGTVSNTQAATGVVKPIYSSLAATTPANVSADAGQTATFSTIASGGIMPYTYQWQLSSNGGINFSNISFATSESYTTGTLTTTYNGYQYRVVVLDAASDSVISGAATLTVDIVLSATVTPSSLSVDSGQTALLAANPTGGISPYSYQWYSCTDSSRTSATAILGATSSTYSPSTATTGTYYHQAVVMDSAPTPETVTTNVATLTIDNALSATGTPSSLSVDSGQTANFTANPVGGTSPYSYQWYSCTDSTCVSPTIISGETSSTYSPSTTTTGTYYYQAVVTDSASSAETATTNVATLTINGALSTILSNPSSLSVYTNQTANFTANPTGGFSPYSYQWYSCTDSTCASTTIISGATRALIAHLQRQ